MNFSPEELAAARIFFGVSCTLLSLLGLVAASLLWRRRTTGTGHTTRALTFRSETSESGTSESSTQNSVAGSRESTIHTLPRASSSG